MNNQKTRTNRLLTTAYLVSLSNNRKSSANTKSRSEVRGGGRKPWRQKGTGRARQGSIRSPQFIGGGVVFGPTKLKNYRKSLPQKMRQGARRSLLMQAKAQKKLVVVDVLPDIQKTKEAQHWLIGLGLREGIIYIVDVDNKNWLPFSNLPYVQLAQASSLRLDYLMQSDFIVITKKAHQLIK